jgi:hypothetical protein
LEAKGKLTVNRLVLSTLRIALAAVICACAWASGATRVNAAEEPVTFKSDYQQEIRGEQVLLLQGNVEVHFREYIVYADEVRLNDEKDEFFGVGTVRLVGTDRDIFADSIWYNYARDDFDMRNTRGSLMVQGVSELVWFEAEQLRGNIDNYKMVNGRLTTCTPEERREYHIEARSIKVLPGHKIIFRNGYFFVMNLPLLWFPFWAFSLEETPWTVEVGKDSFNGTYVKTRYNYMAEELIIGALVFEYYSRRGYLVGADHSYVLPRHGNGSFRWTATLGTYRNDSTGAVLHANTYSVNLQQALLFGSRFTGSVAVTASSSYNIGRGRSNDINGSFSGSYNAADSSTSLSFTGRSTTGATQSDTMTLGLLHNRSIFEDITASLRMDYKVNKQNESGPADEDMTTHAEFRQQLEGWSWNAIVDSHWDPDSFTYLPDRNKSYTDRLPEINITFQPTAFPAKYRDWLGFQMQQLNLVGALYYIGPELTEKQGFYGRMDTRFSRTDKLSASSTIQTSIDYWQAIASTGDARYVYNLSSNWTWNLSQKLSSQLSWTRADEEGRIPFSGYDRPGSPSNRLSYTLGYNNGRLYSVRLTTGYSLNERYQPAIGHIFSIRRLQPLSVSLNYSPSDSTQVTFSTQYDPWRGDFGAFRSTINTTNNRSYRVQSTISVQPPGRITQFTTSSTFTLGPTWDCVVNMEFARQASESIIRDIQITHRLDCTYLAFQYRTQNNEWFLNWGITAYPQARLGYSTTEQAFGPDFFNSFSGSGSGFTGGGFNFNNLGGYSGY